MNILMVYPRYPVTFWSFKHAMKYISKKAAFLPLGLLTLAGKPRILQKRREQKKGREKIPALFLSLNLEP